MDMKQPKWTLYVNGPCRYGFGGGFADRDDAVKQMRTLSEFNIVELWDNDSHSMKPVMTMSPVKDENKSPKGVDV